MNKKEKLLLYCTKSKPYLCYNDIQEKWTICNKLEQCDHVCFNGEIVAECDCEKVEEIRCRCVPYCNKNNLGYEHFLDNGVYKVEWSKNFNLVHENEGVVFERNDRYIDSMFKNSDLEKMCLTPQELLDYINMGNNGYALHLSNLEIFDIPKKLKEYRRYIDSNSFYDFPYEVTKAPQNMCYVYDKAGNKYILLPIRPEHLVNILNGIKTIEVRRKILNSLKELIR